VEHAVNGRDDVVLCVNSGSSSLKLSVTAFRGSEERRLAGGTIEVADGDHAAALARALDELGEQHIGAVTVAGHRVVHGGRRHTAPALVDDALVASLRELVPLAPLHMPAALACIEEVRARYPDLPQVACFDTAFHATMPEVAHRLPIPDRFAEGGVRRFGFHGLSYEYVMSALGAERPEKVIIAHLGNGASLVAVAGGRAIDTTMGLTPSGGVVMGTRTGDLDPGVLLYLAREHGLSVDDLEHLVDHESGLLALGGSADMRELVARIPDDPRARLAVEVFGYSVRKAVGALTAALGGVDLLVFTGGIGENAPAARTAACRGLGALGIVLDAERNQRGDPTISAHDGRCLVRVIRTDEDRMVARHARAMCAAMVAGSVSGSIGLVT